MKIYSMTATFGKLEHQTLQLKPGLNIIEAPNEWGKSTWCAFLVNMLYGIDTRARSTGAALADKERYAPWSGSPMSGRIDLCWKGRDITIERSSKGRIIFGNFRAYETETGIDIPELNGTNCGQQLLGVERSVFTRAGFLKQADLPVTQDDSLRRRLNNLVTTGDESGAGDKLSQTLKDLKNKCRYNRSGLLPQAELERDQLMSQLSDLHSLENQAQTIRSRQALLEQQVARLENHAQALRYEASLEDLRRVEEAQQQLEQRKAEMEDRIALCRSLPPREETQQKLHTARTLQDQVVSSQMESRNLPPMPQEPETPAHYFGFQPETAEVTAHWDVQEMDALEASMAAKNHRWTICNILAVLVLAVATALRLFVHVENGIVYLALGIAALLLTVIPAVHSMIFTKKWRDKVEAIYDRHPGMPKEMWEADAAAYAQRQREYEEAVARVKELHREAEARTEHLQKQIRDLTGGATLTEVMDDCARQIAAWDALAEGRRDLELADRHYQTLRSVAKLAQPPKEGDTLTYDAANTARLLEEARMHQHQLNVQLGQCLGQKESLGAESRIKARLDTLNHRIARLEDTYYALEMAQDALREATAALQRRFAPRISRRAQQLLEKLTGGRYNRLTMGQDMSLQVSASEEDTLRASQWRSDGTVDQLYLALRLAVAEELTPDAPLVLDDAFVRFDDTRLKAALDILRETAKIKQVILFTCQGREKNALEGENP